MRLVPFFLYKQFLMKSVKADSLKDILDLVSIRVHNVFICTGEPYLHYLKTHNVYFQDVV